MTWSNWRPFNNDWKPSERTLQETLDGGQAFRWRTLENNSIWQGIFGQSLCQLRQEENHSVSIRGYKWSNKDYSNARAYLGNSVPWDHLIECLPHKCDPHLATCMDSFQGLRLLQQPFGETLLAFMCSATKRIPQIKIMCENLAQKLGSPIAPNYHSLPTWDQVAATDENTLRALGLGFRAKNIKKTADIIAATPGFLESVQSATYLEAKTTLLELPGIGEKIADCALLFGAAKQEAFPVDTWILKVLEKRYNLSQWNNAQLAQFGRIHFGKYAGFAQQFLFSWERAHGSAHD